MTPAQPDTQAEPLVCILIVNWNGGTDVLACLQSLFACTYANLRVTVIDNGSADGSPEAISAAFPQVHLIRNARNERFARANNQGIAFALEAGAAFILLLNNDTTVAPDFLAALVRHMQAEPTIGIAGPKIFHADPPDLLWFAGGRVSLWKGEIAHIGLRERDSGQYDSAAEVDYITGCCLLVSRTCAEKVGLLDEAYFMYTEDVDYCFRAKNSGFRVVFVPEAKIWHKISASSGGAAVAGGLTPFKITHKIRGTLKFFRRYAHWYHWLTIPLFLKWWFLKSAAHMLRAKNWSGIRAMILAPFTRRQKAGKA